MPNVGSANERCLLRNLGSFPVWHLCFVASCQSIPIFFLYEHATNTTARRSCSLHRLHRNKRTFAILPGLAGVLLLEAQIWVGWFLFCWSWKDRWRWFFCKGFDLNILKGCKTTASGVLSKSPWQSETIAQVTSPSLSVSSSAPVWSLVAGNLQNPPQRVRFLFSMQWKMTRNIEKCHTFGTCCTWQGRCNHDATFLTISLLPPALFDHLLPSWHHGSKKASGCIRLKWPNLSGPASCWKRHTGSALCFELHEYAIF